MANFTKQGYNALERAGLNKEGENDSFELSPYKHYLNYYCLLNEINDIKKASKINYTPMILKKQIKTLVNYFNLRGKEYQSLNTKSK